uniref:Uncharacterized protein n=1 Tax=Arundo donax TaxID=35708 RepID=A0A0A8ZBR5_ARUDO
MEAVSFRWYLSFLDEHEGNAGEAKNILHQFFRLTGLQLCVLSCAMGPMSGNKGLG